MFQEAEKVSRNPIYNEKGNDGGKKKDDLRSRMISLRIGLCCTSRSNPGSQD